jgi:hypothetical protein
MNCDLPGCDRKAAQTFSDCGHNICKYHYARGINWRKCEGCSKHLCEICSELELYVCKQCGNSCAKCSNSGFYCSACEKHYCDACLFYTKDKESCYETCHKCDKSYCDTEERDCALHAGIGKYDINGKRDAFCNECVEKDRLIKKKKRKQWSKGRVSPREKQPISRTDEDKSLETLKRPLELDVPPLFKPTLMDTPQKIEATPEYKKRKIT